MDSRHSLTIPSPMERSISHTKFARRCGDRMDIEIFDEKSNSPALVTISSPNENRVPPRETWPSPPFSTLPILPLRPLTISFAGPLDGAREYFPPMTHGEIFPARVPLSYGFVEPEPSDWFLQRLQKRLRPEDIPCIPSTERQYQKRYRQSKGNHRHVRPPVCLFLNYFERTQRCTPRPINTVAAATVKKQKLTPPTVPKAIVSPKSSFSGQDSSRTQHASSFFGVQVDENMDRPSWNDIVSQTIQDDDDSDCFSISSIDASFEMHHYAEDVVVQSALHNQSLLLPVFRGNGTKVKHTRHTIEEEKRSAPMLPPLVENDSPGRYS